MSQDPASLEAMLCEAYREEIAAYTRALACAGEVSRELGGAAPSDVALAGMLIALDAVADIESRVAGLKNAWRQQQCQPGPELSALLDQAAQLILQLTAQVEQAEQLAAAHKARLSPELNTASRGRQMQQAYGQAMLHGQSAFGLSSR